ncbi:MAG: hypothetical protein M3081_18940 [Gemmatimonadota bacterium]|nr:hypothetical protein [Gemmatimonadota bacterium]
MSPYAPNDGPWAADFQSDPGHGQSHTIVINFSAPVSTVAITIWDPDFPGNSMTAYDASGAVISSQGFGYDLTPGRLTTETVTASGAISRIVLVAALGDYVSYSMQIRAGATFSVKCSGSPGGENTVERGGVLSCVVADPSFGPFQWSFSPSVGTVPAVTRPDTPDKTWTGPMAASGTITVAGWSQVGDVGLKPRETATATIAVTARAWASQPLQFPSLPSNGGQGKLSPMALWNGTDWVMTYGLFEFVVPKSISGGTINGGPNDGYVFVLQNFQIPQPVVYINSALSAGSAFASNQTGSFNGNTVDPATKLPYCTTAALPLLRAQTERHEGLTGAANSHYGIWAANMKSATMSADIEKLVFPTGTAVVTAAFGVFNAWVATVKPQQAAFDAAEYPLIPVWSGGCQLVLQP